MSDLTDLHVCSECGGYHGYHSYHSYYSYQMAGPDPVNLPPREAVEHYRSKGLHAGFSWLDTDAATHLRSFTVAKAMRLDILGDIRTEVDRAIADGTTFKKFRKELEPKLREHGWWGRQQMVDPETGESRLVQLGSPRRLRIIFDTNLRTSYARGQWERIERVAEARPYLRYVAVQDKRTRPRHAAWHGTILRWNHPFWKTHYPPNGWACRCTVQQLSEDDLEEFGFVVSDAPPPDWDQTREWRNKRTGEVQRVPRGIARGFAHNVGLRSPHFDDSNRLIAAIDAAEPALQRAAVGAPWDSPLFRYHAKGEFEPEKTDWPIAVLNDRLAEFLGASSRVVRLSGATAKKQREHRKGQDFDFNYYAIVQQAIDRGEWFVGRTTTHIEGYVEISPTKWLKAVLKRDTPGQRLYLTTLHRTNRPTDQKRHSSLIKK